LHKCMEQVPEPAFGQCCQQTYLDVSVYPQGLSA
jgi:hypothetical protein